MGGLVGLPLRLGGLERAASAPRNPGLLALLVAHLRHLLRRQTLRSRRGGAPTLGRLRVLDLRVGPPGRRPGCRQPCRWCASAGLAATYVTADSRSATGARSPTIGPTAAAAADRHRLQRRPARAGHRHAASRRAVLRTAPSAPRLVLTASVSSIIASV